MKNYQIYKNYQNLIFYSKLTQGSLSKPAASYGKKALMMFVIYRNAQIIEF